MTYPYVAGAVLLASDLNTDFAAKTDLAMTQNAQTGTTYSFVLLDASKLLTTSNASAVSVTVTKQATVTWVTGTQLRIMNLGAGVTTLVADTGVTINGNVALAQYQGGTLIRTAIDVWLFVPTNSNMASNTASVLTSQTTTSTSYTDLSTAGPAATLTTGTKALVIFNTFLTASGTGPTVSASVAVSGATTLAASDDWRVTFDVSSGGFGVSLSRTVLFTGLTAGSNTFTVKYKTSSGTATFATRSIVVMNMGS